MLTAVYMTAVYGIRTRFQMISTWVGQYQMNSCMQKAVGIHRYQTSCLSIRSSATEAIDYLIVGFETTQSAHPLCSVATNT
jgi:hypothetical protein